MSSYAPPGVGDIAQAILDSYRNLMPGADTRSDGELYRRAQITAGAVWQVMWGIRWMEDQFFITSADGDHLRRWAAIYDITPLEPTVADDGALLLTGTNGTVVSAGIVAAALDGTLYTTTSGGTITDGELLVTAEAQEAGRVGNRVEGDELTVQSPPTGVDLTATVDTAFTDGTDAETNTALRERVLARVRAGNAGGTASDYEQWARAVPGVRFATCLPLRRGAGTVDVAVFGEDGDGRRALPSDDLRADVLAALELERPVCADVGVPVLVEVLVNVVLADLVLDDGLEVDDVRPALEAAHKDVVAAVPPGGTLYRVQAIRALAAVEGVATFTLTSPSADVVSALSTTTVEVLMPGTLSAS